VSSKTRLGFVALAFILALGCSKPHNQALLDQHRNLGKAFYENPTTQQDAVREFQQALTIENMPVNPPEVHAGHKIGHSGKNGESGGKKNRNKLVRPE